MYLAIIILIISYLIGSIPSGLWYTRLVHHQDIRSLGSGNIGATNVGRHFGLKSALIVTILDGIKGFLPVMCVRFLVLPSHPELEWLIAGAAIGAVIGHAYPVFAGFSGGKIVATSFGALIATHAWIGVASVGVLILVLYLTSTMSLAAMITYTAGSAFLLIAYEQKMVALGYFLISIFLAYRHKSNIRRLLAGTENRINWGLNQIDDDDETNTD